MQQAFRLWSPACVSGAILPEMYLRRDANSSPPLKWENLPEGSQSLTLLCFDPDAPYFWYHWVLTNIPVTWQALPQNYPRLRQTQGLIQGSNSFHQIGYDGPEPPSGEEHRYFFRLYALNQILNITPGMPGTQVAERLKGKILGRTDFMVRAASPVLDTPQCAGQDFNLP